MFHKECGIVFGRKIGLIFSLQKEVSRKTVYKIGHLFAVAILVEEKGELIIRRKIDINFKITNYY